MKITTAHAINKVLDVQMIINSIITTRTVLDQKFKMRVRVAGHSVTRSKGIAHIVELKECVVGDFIGNGCDGIVGGWRGHQCVRDPNSETPSDTPNKIENEGEECWDNCSRLQGGCPWCGSEGMCCRANWVGNGCDGNVGGPNRHECTLASGGTGDTESGCLLQNKYLAGYANGGRTAFCSNCYADAKDRCKQVGNCGGITKENNNEWSLRIGTSPRASTSNEISALKSCFAPTGW